MSRRTWTTLAAVAGAFVLALALGAWYFAAHAEDLLRQRIVTVLADRFDSDVALDRLEVDLVPRARVEGHGLRLTFHKQPDYPPLIQVRRFSVDATWHEIVFGKRDVNRVELDGLEINIPPRQPKDGQADDDAPGPGVTFPVVIRELVTTQAMLRIHPRNRQKNPREWPIHSLRMTNLGGPAPAEYQTELTNATPPGRISAIGTFGPWQREAPSLTPITGDYRFLDADLGVFKGIAGTLESTGTFRGPLERIAVKGVAKVPDFSLRIAKHPLPLETRFDALVDGTDGDTYLNDVEATLRDTPIKASGKIVGTPGVKGRTIELTATIDDGRIEDLMELTVAGARVPMRGRVSLQTSFLLPPGDRDVSDKLELGGRFGVGGARFTSATVQQKINEMSRKARGEPESEAGTLSNLGGSFRLDEGVLSFSRLTFEVEGARVSLNGRYRLEGGALDFTGRARLRAKVSQTMTGFKSVLAKAVDPLFKRGEWGTDVPITVTGTVKEPKFGVDVKKALLRK